MNINGQAEGSYTIEASILMPLILFFIAAFLYSGFYLHDVLNTKAVLYRFALQNNREGEEINTGEAVDYLNEKLITAVCTNVVYHKDEKAAFLTASYHFKLPLKGIYTLLFSLPQDRKEEIVTSNFTKSEFLRKWKSIKNLKKEE